MVAGTGEGHGKEDCVKAGEPGGVDVGKGVFQGGGEDAVPGVEEHIARHQGDAAVDEGGHIARPEDVGPPDVEVLREEHNGDAHHIHRHNEAQGQFQGVPYKLGHGPRQKEPENRQRIRIPGGVALPEDAGEGVQAGQEHEAEEEIGEEQSPHKAQGALRREVSRCGTAFHDAPSSPLEDTAFPVLAS